jgi:hypothetical protein
VQSWKKKYGTKPHRLGFGWTDSQTDDPGWASVAASVVTEAIGCRAGFDRRLRWPRRWTDPRTDSTGIVPRSSLSQDFLTKDSKTCIKLICCPNYIYKTNQQMIYFNKVQHMN